MYASCGNRNCPICPALKKETWLHERSKDLLPVKYYHVIFTIPHELNLLCANHPRVMYNLLFRTAWKSLYSLMKSPIWCGGQTGMLAVLHTWGQQMLLHPHLHCVVPAGGLSFDKMRWVHTKNDTVLVDAETLMNDFKQLFINQLRDILEDEKFLFVGEAKQFCDATLRENLYTIIEKKKWSVWLKAPNAGPQQTLEYLSRYVNSVAISESRILEIKDDSLRIQYKNYARENADGLPEKEVMELTDFEFLKRFTAHILPLGFQRIRYYGILAPVNRKVKLATARKLLSGLSFEFTTQQIRRFIFQKTGIDPTVCNACGSPNRDTVIIPADPVLHRKIVNFPNQPNPPPKHQIPLLIPERKAIVLF